MENVNNISYYEFKQGNRIIRGKIESNTPSKKALINFAKELNKILDKEIEEIEKER